MNICYIAKPHFGDLASKELHYTDILTYVGIKSFKNKQTKKCFPSYETIASIIGASRGFVIDSIERLEAAGYITIERSETAHVSNKYYFPNHDLNNRVPFEVLNLELTIFEKSMLLLLREFCEATPVDVHNTLTDIAKKTGLTYKTIYTQVQRLLRRGVIEKRPKDQRYFRLTDIVDWHYNYDFPKSQLETERNSLVMC